MYGYITLNVTGFDWFENTVKFSTAKTLLFSKTKPELDNYQDLAKNTEHKPHVFS